MIDELTLQIGSENLDEVLFGDLFYLNYYGVNVFFYVCRTSLYQVAIYEIKKKRIKYENQIVEIIDSDLKPSHKPLVVTENNCWTKSRFWVNTTHEKKLLIPININTPVYKEAIKQGTEFPETGYFEAVWLEEEQKKGVANYYWNVVDNFLKKMS